MFQRVIRPASIIARAPPPPSSAGWKASTILPSKLRVSARYLAAPSSIEVWPSWPQACILPGMVEACGRPVASWIGSASMSARKPMVRPDEDDRPVITPTTPVPPKPVTTSSQPNSFSFSATSAAVRCSSKRSSGWAWMSRRQPAISGSISAKRLMTGMGVSG